MMKIIVAIIAALRALAKNVMDAFDMVIEAIDRLDQHLMPRSHWRYVGSDKVLYETELSYRGFQFVAHLSLDHRSVTDMLGEFSHEYSSDAIQCDDGRYFRPRVTEEQRFLSHSCHGLSEPMARQQARVDAILDLSKALMFGTTWYRYELTVSAKRGNLTLASVGLRGIEADIGVSHIDPCIDQVTASLLGDLERAALSALAKLRPSSIPMKIGAFQPGID